MLDISIVWGFMRQVKNLEIKLVEVLDKKAPIKLSDKVRKDLARIIWVLSLVLGVLLLWGMFDRLALRMLDYGYSSGAEPVEFGFFYYLSLMFLTIAAAMLLVAAPALKARKRSGWHLVYYALLINLAYGVVSLFAESGGFGVLLWALVTSVISGYFVFQVRDQFKAN